VGGDRPDLEAGQLTAVAELEFAALPALVDIELTGMKVDRAALTALQQSLADARDAAVTAARAALNAPTLNLRSAQQLLAVLRERGMPVSSTGKDALRPLTAAYPALQHLLDYKHVDALQRSVATLSGHVRPDTGRIHTRCYQLGAETGRLSTRDPNLQNIPRDRRIRACFIAPPGSLLVIADLSQIELRIAAELGGDAQMIAALQENQDLHRLTASLLTGTPLAAVTPADRQAAKAVNFGLIYAMGPQGLRNSARARYDVDVTVEQAQRFIERFFTAYPGVAAWQEQVKRRGAYECRTLSGRRHRWPTQLPLTELLNTPVQGTGADILKRALALLPAALTGTGARIVGTVHDEIILEAPKARAEEAATRLEAVLQQAGRTYLTRVPIEVEVVIANNWVKP
jgi:DNA polymerase-1